MRIVEPARNLGSVIPCQAPTEIPEKLSRLGRLAFSRARIPKGAVGSNAHAGSRKRRRDLARSQDVLDCNAAGVPQLSTATSTAQGSQRPHHLVRGVRLHRGPQGLALDRDDRVARSRAGQRARIRSAVRAGAGGSGRAGCRARGRRVPVPAGAARTSRAGSRTTCRQGSRDRSCGTRPC